MPGVSKTAPPNSSGINCAAVVVCRPFSLSWLTSADGQAQSRLDRIEKTALAHTALARQSRLFAVQQGFEVFDVAARFRRGQQNSVSQGRVDPGNLLEADGIDQVNLVDHNDRLHVALFGGQQEAIDQSGFQRGFGRAGDDQQIVNVRHEDVLLTAAGAADHSAPRFDMFDHSIEERSRHGCEHGPRRRERFADRCSSDLSTWRIAHS